MANSLLDLFDNQENIASLARKSKIAVEKIGEWVAKAAGYMRSKLNAYSGITIFPLSSG